MTMLVQLAPRASRENIPLILGNVESGLYEVMNLRGPASERVAAYIRWTSTAARVLRGHLTAREIDRLVYTRRFSLLLSSNLQIPDAAANDPLNLELEERLQAFQDARETLRRKVESWSKYSWFLGFDTTFFIQYSEKLADADFRPLVGALHDPIHLLIPMVVVDELDRLKEHNKAQVRWRAGHTLGKLFEVLQYSGQPGVLHKEDFSALNTGGIPRGEITVEVIFDPPGHNRLPIEDDEIIDQLVIVQPMTPSGITFVTYDTGPSAARERSWS
jgi:hypothetical protein